MKQAMKTLLAFVAGAAATVSCNVVEINNTLEGQTEEATTAEQTPATGALVQMTFNAFTESDADTKAIIDALNIKWSAGDKISVFDGYNNCEFTLSDGAGTTRASFTGSGIAHGATYYALYPYSIGEHRLALEDDCKMILQSRGIDTSYLTGWKNSWSSDRAGVLSELECYSFYDSTQEFNIIYSYLNGTETNVGPYHHGDGIYNVIIPAEQTVAAGEHVDPNAVLMVAKSTDAHTFQFKNVMSYIKVTPTEDCDRIIIYPTYTSFPSCINVTVQDSPVYEQFDGELKVSLSGNIKGGETYYIAVAPELLSNGLVIRYFPTSLSGAFKEKVLDAAFQLVRNKVYNAGAESGKAYVDWIVTDDSEWIENKDITAVVVQTNYDGVPVGNKLDEFQGLCAQNSEDILYIRTKADGIRFISSLGYSNLFKNCSKVESFTGLDKIDVSEVSDFVSMFESCSSLKSIDLSSWYYPGPDASFFQMFSGCSELETVSLPTVGSISNIERIFKNCEKLSSVTVGNNFTIDDCVQLLGAFSGAATSAAGGLTIYGVTDSETKKYLKNVTIGVYNQSSGWNGSIMRFDGESFE